MESSSWLNLCFIIVLTLAYVQGEVLKSVLWDPRNSLFEGRCSTHDNEDYAKIFVNSMAKLSFICPSSVMVPRRSAKPVSSRSLFENLHIVSKREFDNCEVDTSNPDSRLLLSCDQALSPNYLKYFTVVFRQWRASSNGLKFTPNQTYYFIATSDGSKASLQNLRGGNCKSRNMRLAVTICGWDCSSCPNMCCREIPVTTLPPTTPSKVATTRTSHTSKIQVTLQPKTSSHVVSSRNKTVQIDDQINNSVKLQRQSSGARSGDSFKSMNPVLLFISGFIVALLFAAIIFGTLQYRRHRKRQKNIYGSDCKTRVDSSPSIHQKGRPKEFQRLYSTSSSKSGGSGGTDSL